MTLGSNCVVKTLPTARFGDVRTEFYQPHQNNDVFIALHSFRVQVNDKDDYVARGAIFLGYGNGAPSKKFYYYPSGITSAARSMREMLWQYDQEEGKLFAVDLAVSDTKEELGFWTFMSAAERKRVSRYLVETSASLVPHPHLNYDENKIRAADRMRKGVKDKTGRANPTATRSRLQAANWDLEQRQADIASIRPYMAMRADILEAEQQRILRELKELLLFLKSSLKSTVIMGSIPKGDASFERQVKSFYTGLNNRIPNAELLPNPFLKTVSRIVRQAKTLENQLLKRQFSKARQKINQWIADIELFDYIGITSHLLFVLATSGQRKLGNTAVHITCADELKTLSRRLRRDKSKNGQIMWSLYKQAYENVMIANIKQTREALQVVERIFC